MSKPILDKAEVSIDFPDKFYHGTFSHSSRYNVDVDATGVHIALDREGEEKRHVAFHLHHQLFSSLLVAVAESIASSNKLEKPDLERLKEAVGELAKSLK